MATAIRGGQLARNPLKNPITTTNPPKPIIKNMCNCTLQVGATTTKGKGLYIQEARRELVRTDAAVQHKITAI